MKIRSNLAYRIKVAFGELGINIPFPIRTLKLDEDDRSFLKTMDSMKKGEVPEPKEVPNNDKIVIAASEAAFEKQIPYDIFEDKQKVPNAKTDNIVQSHEKIQATEQAESEGPAKQPKTEELKTEKPKTEEPKAEEAPAEEPKEDAKPEVDPEVKKELVGAVAVPVEPKKEEPMTPPPTHI